MIDYCDNAVVHNIIQQGVQAVFITMGQLRLSLSGAFRANETPSNPSENQSYTLFTTTCRQLWMENAFASHQLYIQSLLQLACSA